MQSLQRFGSCRGSPCRLLSGLTLAHLAEHYGAGRSPGAFAAYITGNVASNFLGRLIAATLADHGGVGAAFIGFAGLNVLGAALAWRTIGVGSSRAHSFDLGAGWRAIRAHLRDPRLCAGFTIGFCILFAFIGVFTYVNFVLVAPPLSIGMMELGLIYLVFVPAVITTPLAGAVVLRLGSRSAAAAGLGLGVASLPLLLASHIVPLLAGMALFSVGTFFAQAVATGAVSHAALDNKGAASGLYLASYFLGGLVGTAIVGALFDAFGWPSCLIAIGAVLGFAIWITLSAFDAR